MIHLLTDNDETEEIANAETMLRRQGDVYVTTIPSKLMGLNALKRQRGKKRPILVVRRAGRYVIEVLIEEEIVEP